MTLPNFFVVGAPKAGTDALYYDLDQHPQIYMSPLKEPCYFSSEIRVDNFVEELQPSIRKAADSLREYLAKGASEKRFGGIVTSLEDYERLFLHARNERAIGEGSVCYLWSASAGSAIAATVPSARIIIVLMDPAERAFHQYLKSLADGNVTHSFDVHLERAFQADRNKMSVYHPFLEFGSYAKQVRRYLSNFPPEQIHISLYENRQSDPAGWFRSILGFLGVDDSFVPRPVDVPSKPHFQHMNAVGTRLNQLGGLKKLLGKAVSASFKTRIKHALCEPQAAPNLSRENRAALVRYYRDDILETQELLNRDLSAWLQY